MKNDLVRFGVAMEAGLVAQLDRLAELRNCNRSELLRDLVRAELRRTELEQPAPAFSVVTLVYEHFVRGLSERLTTVLNGLGDRVCSSLHVRLNRTHSLETIVLQGQSEQVRDVSNRILGIRGVLQGNVEYVVLATRDGSRVEPVGWSSGTKSSSTST